MSTPHTSEWPVTAGQIADKTTDTPIIAPAENTCNTDKMRGHSLHRTDPSDGAVTYWAERWGLVRYLPTLHDAALFLAQIGGLS